ncbi:CPCC family cysteine-rich protein [Asanoa iriomotensis]|uniref:Cysteine-rich CPCC domain-containing protein n=1 Tax=Asanoa iriomotensis TaxID=234613 RepID=A0ABQ4BWV3_9ACTN|nr:CPCC family cysteine-rich protein [Asanoa iriomotensis]GIF54989.1 hypothetical protein Air01nite_10840 [Asanoa iriomotensis]
MHEHAGKPGGRSAEEVERRTRWAEQYIEALCLRSVVAETGSGPYACPCCQYPTLDGRGQFQMCFVCGWEDDGQDDEDADTVRGGPNGPISLTEARHAYAKRQARWERRRRRSRPETG